MAIVGRSRALVATAGAQFGRIDVLVNNAAETNSSGAPIDEMPRTTWLHEFDVNIHAPFTLIGAVLPYLREQGGGSSSMSRQVRATWCRRRASAAT